jgi:uncharacterized protein YukE
VASLAPFSYDWVGGNIHGLSQLAGTLFAYVPEMTGVASALDAQVRRIVGAAGWQGSAASAFSSAWQKDSATARAVALVTEQMGIIVDWLAVHLARIESTLEQAADEARKHGVSIGPGGAPEATCETAEGRKWLAAYTKLWRGCMIATGAVRVEAAVGLAGTCQRVTTSSGCARPGRRRGHRRRPAGQPAGGTVSLVRPDPGRG